MNKSVITGTKEIELIRDSYLNKLLQQCEQQSLVKDDSIGNLLQQLRQKAAYQVLESRLPTQKDEEWRFTDLSPLIEINFQLGKKNNIHANALEEFIIPEAKESRLVLINGIYTPEWSDVSGMCDRVYVGNITELSAPQKEKIEQYLGTIEETNTSDLEPCAFTALNTAGLNDVAVIWVNSNAVVEKPIHILHLSVGGETPYFSQPRTLVIGETSSSLELIEEYGTIGNNGDNCAYLTNGVTEIWVQENASVRHSRIQRESEAGFHLGKSAIAQARDSRYTCTEVNLGAKLSRHNLEIHQKGEQTETYLNGLTVVGGEQLADTHSAVLLSKPHGTINQLHKCIVDDSARTVFNGRVFVPKAAQQTDAAQLNRNLLLSPKARVNTKPELQITADDVKCSHGATISQLEADEVFYLRSRGLNERDACVLLIDAFASEILQRIPVPSLNQKLAQRIAVDS